MCLRKDSKDGASLGSCGREFQRMGSTTEKALSHVATECTREGGKTERKISELLIIFLTLDQAHKGRCKTKGIENKLLFLSPPPKKTKNSFTE